MAVARRFQPVESEVQLLAIRHRGQQITDRLGLIAARQDVAQGEEIAQRFRHLLAFHHQEFGVQPEAREGLAGERFRLGDLVLVMRKDQVDAAGVNIERLAQVFDAPSRSTRCASPAGPARWAFPRTGLAFFGRLPQHEIAGVGFLVFVHVHARAGEVAAEIVVRELAVLGEGRDAEVDGAVARIGVAGLRPALDGRGHVGDVLGGVGQTLGPFQAQRAAVFEKRSGVERGVLL